MCAPVALLAASLAVSAAATGAQYMGQQKAAKAQSRYNKQAAEEGSRLAMESLALQSQQMAARSKQEAEAKSQAVMRSQQEFMKAKASAKVAAGESGVSGVSVDQLLADFDFQEDLEITAIETNASYAAQQLQMEKLGIRANTQRQLNGLRAPPVPRPSLLNAGLQFGGQALGAYTSLGNAPAKNVR